MYCNKHRPRCLSGAVCIVEEPCGWRTKCRKSGEDGRHGPAQQIGKKTVRRRFKKHKYGRLVNPTRVGTMRDKRTPTCCMRICARNWPRRQRWITKQRHRQTHTPSGLCEGVCYCVQVCPVESILPAQDIITGKYYSFIDASRCIECGACCAVCPIEGALY
jgi:ferredoxin